MAQYYGISASRTKETPVRRGDGWGSVALLHWHVYSGPCASRAEAESQAIAKIGPNNAEDMEQKTLHRNLVVVSKSKLRAYRISLDRVEVEDYAEDY